MHKTLTFSAAHFAVDKAARTLTGTLLPFGEVSRPARDPQTGMVARFRFAEGTVNLPDPGEVILNFGHDRESLAAQVGVAASLTPTTAGVDAVFKVARTPEGDRVLALAEDKILRAFSAEVEGQFESDPEGIQNAILTNLTGAAVVLKGAFTGAQITSVAASAAQTEGATMPCTKCGVLHAAGVTECDPIKVTAFQAAGHLLPKTPEPVAAGADLAGLMGQVQTLTEKLADLENIRIPVGPGAAQFQVREEPIYRFSGTTPAPSGFDFATDLLAAGKDGDMAALKRIQDFTAERLNPQGAVTGMSPEFVTTGNTSSVNPSQYRPDMFLGQAPVPASPLYDFFYKGALADVTPFFWTKLDRVSTTVATGDHTEGTDPTLTNLVTAAGTTVTPIPVSGRVHITREVADQGGNPVVSGLVWSEFDRSFKVSLETKTAAIITAGLGSVTALATITTGTSGLASSAAVESGLVDLQFQADGFRYTKGFGHVDLYKALAGATLTTTGEKVYPIIAPSNRDGSMADKFAHMNVAGYELYPAAGLGVTGGTKNSLIADPIAVHVWNSGLMRLEKLQEKVEGWDMGVFAYFAGLLYDATGLRKITYTP